MHSGWISPEKTAERPRSNYANETESYSRYGTQDDHTKLQASGYNSPQDQNTSPPDDIPRLDRSASPAEAAMSSHQANGSSANYATGGYQAESQSGPNNQHSSTNWQQQPQQEDRRPDPQMDRAPICQDYLSGRCRQGSSCRFRHALPEVDEVPEARPTYGSYSNPHRSSSIVSASNAIPVGGTGWPRRAPSAFSGYNTAPAQPSSSASYGYFQSPALQNTPQNGWSAPQQEPKGWGNAPPEGAKTPVHSAPKEELDADGWPIPKKQFSSWVAPIEPSPRSAPAPTQAPMSTSGRDQSFSSTSRSAPIVDNGPADGGRGWPEPKPSSRFSGGIEDRFSADMEKLASKPSVSYGMASGWKTTPTASQAGVASSATENGSGNGQSGPSQDAGHVSGWNVTSGSLVQASEPLPDLPSSAPPSHNAPPPAPPAVQPAAQADHPGWRTSTPKASPRPLSETQPTTSYQPPVQMQAPAQAPAPASVPTSQVSQQPPSSSGTRKRVVSGWTIEEPITPPPPVPAMPSAYAVQDLPQVPTAQTRPVSTASDVQARANVESQPVKQAAELSQPSSSMGGDSRPSDAQDSEAWVLNSHDAIRNNTWSPTIRSPKTATSQQAEQNNGVRSILLSLDEYLQSAAAKKAADAAGVSDLASQTSQALAQVKETVLQANGWRVSADASMLVNEEDSIRPSESASNVGASDDLSSGPPPPVNSYYNSNSDPSRRSRFRQFVDPNERTGSGSRTSSPSSGFDDNPNATTTWDRPTPAKPVVQQQQQSQAQPLRNETYKTDSANGSNWNQQRQPSNGGWTSRGPPSAADVPLPAPTPRRTDSQSYATVNDLERAATPRAGMSAMSAGSQNTFTSARQEPVNNPILPAKAGSSISIRGASKYHAESLQLKEELAKTRSQLSTYERRIVTLQSFNEELQAALNENVELKDRVASLESEREALRTALVPALRLLGLDKASTAGHRNGQDRHATPAVKPDHRQEIKKETPSPAAAGWN